MKTIRPRFGDDIDHAAGYTAEFRFGIVRHSLEFLDQVDIWQHSICWPTDVGVDNSVKEVDLRTVVLSLETGVRKTGIRDTVIAFATANAVVLRSRNRSCSG